MMIPKMTQRRPVAPPIMSQCGYEHEENCGIGILCQFYNKLLLEAIRRLVKLGAKKQ
jgi:hypothetical protein